MKLTVQFQSQFILAPSRERDCAASCCGWLQIGIFPNGQAESAVRSLDPRAKLNSTPDFETRHMGELVLFLYEYGVYPCPSCSPSPRPRGLGPTRTKVPLRSRPSIQAMSSALIRRWTRGPRSR